MFSSFSPRAKRSRLAATALHLRSAVASVLLELCGVISTLGSSWNGRREGLRSGSAWVGYCHQTSSAAPPRRPSFQRGIKRILVDDGRSRAVYAAAGTNHEGKGCGQPLQASIAFSDLGL